eukprot:CAMPEP_0177647252 /NCGR_PEP_ID=MMETSP0447-20121125/10202_1 /TAXON_ID=0 /ORGANISM="Stygamoeba regulata, Strain BSH-02190019" /LENGTH=534 /DNA_ID=CAMNT_0019149827 /DNA_START=25 /DNA_END=1626 /DNA_ORIENTATION=-
MSAGPSSKKKICYYYHEDIGNFSYGQGHPMKPHRIRMTHNLLLNYGLYKELQIYRPRAVTDTEISQFHSDDYVDFLNHVTPNNMHEYQTQLSRFNVGEDCPVFDGLYKYCQLSTGGSVCAAAKLNSGESDIAINWAGGLHHAKKSEASGFCYINDIVLGILELLKYHQRVLYVDIDIHHGDGVEEAFYTTDRVMCVSFHKFGEYFPGTGDVRDVGAGKGKHYSVNFPLRDGVDDVSYESIFKPIIQKVMDCFRPDAVVMQCGADSLAGDRLGCFNLSLKGHADCVEFVKRFNLPLMVLGGGGYTVRNVARCWAYETAILLEKDIPDSIPFNDYFEYYSPEYSLSINPTNQDNLNTKDYLERYRDKILDNLSHCLDHAPSVQMRMPPPRHSMESDDEDDDDPDARFIVRESDAHIEHEAELYTPDDRPERHQTEDDVDSFITPMIVPGITAGAAAAQRAAAARMAAAAESGTIEETVDAMTTLTVKDKGKDEDRPDSVSSSSSSFSSSSSSSSSPSSSSSSSASSASVVTGSLPM